MTPLIHPPADLAAWVEHLRHANIPVLSDTAHTLAAMRANEDAVDARMLNEVIAFDPLMTLKLLSHAGMNRTARSNTDVETVTAALVLMGIGPFFRVFATLEDVEVVLADDAPALKGLNAVLRRARRAATFALAFAVHRNDLDAAVIHEAALLHDFAEMLLWCHAPRLALQMQARRAAEPTLRSSVLQRELLNVELDDLQHALMLEWRLPELLVQITNDRETRHPSVKSVLLAMRLARHTAIDWNNAALPDDVKDIAELLNITPEATLPLLREIDA